MLNFTHFQRNSNQNHNEISSYAGQNGHHQSLQTINAGEGMERRKPSFTGAATRKRVWLFLKQTENRTAI